MYCWIKKIKIKMGKSAGMQKIRESARKEMLQSIAMQVSLYSFSFWMTFVPTIILFVYQTLTKNFSWGFLIFANCIFALQGFIIAMVYFTLERLGTPKSFIVQHIVPSTSRPGVQHGLTVRDIRLNVERKPMMAEEIPDERGGSSGSDSFVFNIFDGVPDKDSPWARFIDCDDDVASDIIDTPEEGGTRPNDITEET